MSRQIIVLLLFFTIWYTKANKIGVYQSLNSTFNGLKFQPKIDSNLTKGITICGRFNYPRIIEQTSILFYVKSMSTYEYLATKMGYQETFWGIADYNWILKEPIKNTFRVWAANRWHHICLALDKELSHFVVVKVILDFIISQITI